MKALVFLAYLATIPFANWLIGNVGTMCIPNGPCLIPVFPGLMAPSGVLMIGAALVLRDAVQQLLGIRWAFVAIACGVLLSVLVAPPALVIASATAFAIAELLDLSVYTPLRRRNLSLAVLAFGSLDFIAGQLVGKLWMTVIAATALTVWHRNNRVTT
jgi:queuosine precursor transporter